MAFNGIRVIVIFSSAVLFAGLAYIAFEPLPEGVPHSYLMKYRIVVHSIAAKLGMLADHLGYDGPDTFKYFAGVFGRLLLLVQSPPPKFNVTHEDQKFDGVPVRIFYPINEVTTANKKTLKRGIVFFHGGGWIFGNVVTYSPLVSMLSQALGAVVVSVDYRLAPQSIFPAAMDDCFKATKYFFKNSKSFNVDKSRISLVGDSAGGNLAAAVTQRLKDEDLDLPKMQALIYPALQAVDFKTPSMMWNQNGPLLTKKLMVWFYNYYIFGHQQHFNYMMENNHTHPHVKQNMPLKYMKANHLPMDDILRSYRLPNGRLDGDIEFWNYHKPTFMNPYLSPLMARTEDIAGLPHTFIISCQHDVLRDDSFHFAARLRKEGVSVEHINLYECYHGWFNQYEVRTIKSFSNNFKQLTTHIDSYL